MIIERDLYTEISKFMDSPEAIVITGMRRTGKTTLLAYIAERIDSSNKLLIDLESPANQKLFDEANYERILDDLRARGLDSRKQSYIFLDEIQFVKNAPSVVKYLSDHYRIKFFLSGSSSFYLKNLFAESLAGRKYIFELFPLNFREFLRLKNPKASLDELPKKVSQAAFLEFDRWYGEYLLYGGFPGVVQKETAEEKKKALEDIFSSYFQLEIIQLGDFKKVSVVRDLMLLMLERVGSKIDIAKLASEMGVARETIGNYLSFFESTYFISLVRPFSRNRDIEIRGSPKFYVCDSGIINNFARVNEGSIFENAVFSALRLKGEVNYYQRKSGVEIDFVLDKRQAFEAKIFSREQDVKKLAMLTGEIGLEAYTLVTRKYTLLPHTRLGFLL